MRRLVLVVLILSTVLVAAHLGAKEDLTPAELKKLGDTYFREKTWKKAIDAYERFLAAAPDDPAAFEANLNIAKALVQLRNWWQGVQRLRPLLGKTAKGSLERAEVARLIGSLTAEHSGGSKETVGLLDEAEAVYAAKNMKAERISTLFSLAEALSHSFNYGVSHEEWKKKYYREGETPEVTWPDYYRERMKEVDEKRYERTVATYRKIIDLDGGAGHDAALARYRLGAFHANVLARAFSTSAVYYPQPIDDEKLRKEYEELLRRYRDEVGKGIAAWRELLEKNPDDSLADDAQYLIGLAWHERLSDFTEAEKAYAAMLETYPRSEWSDNARAALQQIRREEIRLHVPRPFLPTEKPTVGLAARNVATIRFRAYRVDIPAMLAKDYRFHRLDRIQVPESSPYAEWTVDTGAGGDHKGVQKEIQPPLDAPGTFLIHAEGERTTCRALVVISRLGMAMKTAEDQVLLFGTDAVSGEPAPGVRYVVKAAWRVRRVEHTRVFEAAAGDDGIATVDLAGIPGSARIEAAGVEGDHVVLSQSWYSRSSDRDRYRVFCFTDRPVYRPNQNARFKCVVRAKTDDGYALTQGKPVKVEIQDPRGNKVYEKILITNEHGTVSGDLPLPEEPPLGEYAIRTFLDGRQYYCYRWAGTRFRVEEYKKPEFEVTVTAGDARVEPGTEVAAKIEARYYFGAPVVHGEVAWQVFRQPYRHWMPVRREYSWYYRGLYPEPSHYWGRELVAEGKGMLDEQGRLEFTFPAKEHGDGMDSRFIVSANVTDASRRQISGGAAVFATKQPFFTRAEVRRTLMKPGDSVEVSLFAEDSNRKPVKAEGKLLLEKREDREEEVDGKKKPVTDWVEVGSTPAATREDGHGTASLVVDETGHYRLSWVVPNPGGDDIVAHQFVWVVDRDFRGSQYRFSGVEVSTDSDTYRVGQEVKVLVNSHVENAVILLTVEADRRILLKKVIRAEGRSQLLTLTAGEGWTPNVYVKALTIRDRAVFTNRREIIVPPVAKFLDVSITPAKEGTYLPGEKAEFTVKTVGASGEPTSAELAVGFIDKSVLYIAPDHTPDIREFFWGQRRGDRVALNSSFDFQLVVQQKEKPGHALTKYRTRGHPKYMRPWYYNFEGWRRDLGETIGFFWGKVRGEVPVGAREPSDAAPAPSAPAPGFMDGKRRSREAKKSGDMAAGEELELEDPGDDEGGGGAAAEPPAAAPRKFFPDTAYWAAHVVTGPDGTAKVTFAFPDSLTTWKATARGVTDDTAVGSAEKEFTTTKNLIIRLQAPRFFRERDEVVVSGIVHNYFEEPVSARVLIKTEGGCLELLDRGELSKPDQTFTVAAKKEQRIDWWFRVIRPGAEKIRVDAISDKESDAVLMPYPVLEHGVSKYTALAGSFTGPGGRPGDGGKVELRFTVPEDRHEDLSELTVTVSPSMASALLESLPYLADYPYGCVEQTMSRFLPSVVVKKTLTDLGFTLEDLGVDPSREVPDGYWGRKEVQKLKALRTEDLEKMVKEGVKRLADFQQSDGAWGWWKSSPRDLYMTAYVVRGLALAQRAGARVDPAVIKRGATFLLNHLKNVDLDEQDEKGMHLDRDMLTLVAAALIESADLSGEAKGEVNRIVSHLYERRETLGATSRGLLAVALFGLGRKHDAKIVCENLTDMALVDRDNGTCRFGRVAGRYTWRDDAVESTAAALRAYLRVEPDSELIAMMAKWLVMNRRGGHWKSTKDTAHAVLALCDYLRVSKELAPDLTVKISVNGGPAKTVRLTKENVFTADNTLTIRGSGLQAGEQVVSITAEGTGNLYFTGSLEVFTREEGVKGAGNEVFVGRKAYRVHQRTRETTRRVWKKDHYEDVPVTEAYDEREPLADKDVVRVGDVVEIELTLTAKNDYRYLVFEDMKGAGFEPVEKVSGHSYSGLLSYQELRDERTVFFCSSLPQGEHRLRYRLRAEIPGTFHIMPATGQAMYLPEVRAISDELRLTITEPGVR